MLQYLNQVWAEGLLNPKREICLAVVRKSVGVVIHQNQQKFDECSQEDLFAESTVNRLLISQVIGEQGIHIVKN